MIKAPLVAGIALCSLVLSTLVAAPPAAEAAVSYYNCVNKPPYQWCDGRANGSFDGLNSWDYNEGWNPGTGVFLVCERVYRPATGGQLPDSSCGSNWIGHYYGDVQCVCYEAEVSHEASGNRNINGYADSDF